MRKKILKRFVFLFLTIFLWSQHPFFLADNGCAQDEELVNLDYKNADLAAVLRSLAYSYDLNLVVGKDIKGEVTMTLKDVTLDEALEAILSVNGYGYVRKGKIIYVTPGPGLEGMDVATVAIQLNYLSAAEAARLLGKVISSKGDIQINEATNGLVVTDFPANIANVQGVLKEIDIPPLQVLIEAKIVDISSDDLQNLGVTYSADYTDVGLFNQDSSYDHQDEAAGTVTLPGPSTSLSGGQLKLTTLSLKNWEVSATIDALIQDNKAHLLASPSIATLNNKEARIIIGEKYPYKEKTQTTTGTTETTKFVDVGTTLRVTPQVSPDGMITMIVHPEVSSVSESLDAGPRITTREADATVRVRDGQTIVIGGLIKKQDDHTRSKIPFLGDIPIFEYVFSDRRSDLTQKELAVFITPRVIRDSEEIRRVKTVDKEEVYVNIEGVGERVLVARIFESAQNLEFNRGIESRRKEKEFRMADALELYMQIVSQFPVCEKADDALYRIGLLYYRYYKNLPKALEAFSKLVERYPESAYARRSSSYIQKIERRLAKRNQT